MLDLRVNPELVEAIAAAVAAKLAKVPAKVLLTPKEAAAALNISERFLRDLEREGKIAAVRMNSAVRYHVREVERFAAENRGAVVNVGEKEPEEATR